MNYLLFFLLISLVNCKGCKDQCECPDLLDRLWWPEDRGAISYTEGAGCFRNISCVSIIHTFVQFSYADTEIPRPDDIVDNYGAALTVGDKQPSLSHINLFQYFGMICENKEWYITKYPCGVSYGNATGVYDIGTNGEFDGKKTKIGGFNW